MKNIKEIFDEVYNKYNIIDEELFCGVSLVYYVDENGKLKFYVYSGKDIIGHDFINSAIYDYILFNKFLGKEKWKAEIHKFVKLIVEEAKTKVIEKIGLPPIMSKRPIQPILDPIELEKLNPFKAKAAIKHYNELMEGYNLQLKLYKLKEEIWYTEFEIIMEEIKDKYNCGTINIKTEDYLNCKKELLHLLWENGFENNCLNKTMYKNFKLEEN